MFLNIPGTKEEGLNTYSLKGREREGERQCFYLTKIGKFLPGGHSFCSSWQEISVFFWGSFSSEISQMNLNILKDSSDCFTKF
jgi:hypothetical protein